MTGGTEKERFRKYRLGKTAVAILFFTCAMPGLSAAFGKETYGMTEKSASAYSAHPWEKMGETGETYSYSQDCYYEAPYLIEIGWNLNEAGALAYPDKAEIQLSEDSCITVSFGRVCREERSNEEAMASIGRLLEQNPEMTSPLILQVQRVKTQELEALAETYYQQGEQAYFSALVPALDEQDQEQFGSRMLRDGKVSYFAAVLRKLKEPMVQTYAEQAYEANRVNFFAVTVPYLSKEHKQEWISRASRENRNQFLAVLSNIRNNEIKQSV